MMLFDDWWLAEPVDSSGAGLLADAAQSSSTYASARAVARLFALRAIAAAVGDRRPASVDGLVAASYIAALFAADDAEGGALRACLAAAQDQDMFALARTLHEAARLCATRAAPHAARGLAELGYDAALEIGAWQDAYWAARTLERLAILDECVPAAERWGHRADLQLRRVQRGTRAV